MPHLCLHLHSVVLVALTSQPHQALLSNQLLQPELCRSNKTKGVKVLSENLKVLLHSFHSSLHQNGNKAKYVCLGTSLFRQVISFDRVGRCQHIFKFDLHFATSVHKSCVNSPKQQSPIVLQEVFHSHRTFPD
uniref:Secreted protein n=1 Tax=Ditylum brightwellii TaxID=49249 RepID=A0A6V2NJ09_9STRA